jgi:CDGSH-type Zn-finger protein
MARLVRFKAKQPIRIGNPPVSICACGLSKTYPLCSGAHIMIQDEDDDKVYVYSNKGERLSKALSVGLKGGGKVNASDVYSPK